MSLLRATTPESCPRFYRFAFGLHRQKTRSVLILPIRKIPRHNFSDKAPEHIFRGLGQLHKLTIRRKINMNTSTDKPSSGASPYLSGNALFWVCFCVVMIPFVIFFITSYFQLYNILGQIDVTIESQILKVLGDEDEFSDPSSSMTKALVALERDIVLYRHERATAALATRTWMRFMSLSFGASLVVAGAIFVLSGVTTPRTDGTLQLQDFKVAIASKSPGLILVIVGCILIAVPNVIPQKIGIKNTSTYIQKHHHVLEGVSCSLTSDEIDQLLTKPSQN